MEHLCRHEFRSLYQERIHRDITHGLRRQLRRLENDRSNRLGTLGLAVFGVVGCHIALQFGAPFVIAVFMGMVTATGGGLIRDVITNTRPMIMSGQVYATAALRGSLCYASLSYLGVSEIPAELLSCLAAFSLRAAAIVFNIRMGPPGEFLTIGPERKDPTSDRKSTIQP